MTTIKAVKFAQFVPSSLKYLYRVLTSRCNHGLINQISPGSANTAETPWNSNLYQLIKPTFGHAKQFKRRRIKNTSSFLPTADHKVLHQNDALQIIKTTSLTTTTGSSNQQLVALKSEVNTKRAWQPRPAPICFLDGLGNTTETVWELKIQELKRTEELSGQLRGNLRTTQLLRAPPKPRSTTPDWYQSKDLGKTNPAPPVLLQTTAEIDDNLTKKGSVNSNQRGLAKKEIGNIGVEKSAKCRSTLIPAYSKAKVLESESSANSNPVSALTLNASVTNQNDDVPRFPLTQAKRRRTASHLKQIPALPSAHVHSGLSNNEPHRSKPQNLTGRHKNFDLHVASPR
ncbi:Glycosyl hydrolases family 31 protein isoform 1 [Dorcoceras hygrometricum]|uniref:Glycosyl hydrolases family 31 protein isoform 1 n=1 Tax=Dorcoceras hygrometricum TaxID=472368 RepID=A0A2Z7C6P0_9LAMI|nr:Glycosyl hydrolases family 31 protein isoform 1 [Dorcoceras hygrometricum]